MNNEAVNEIKAMIGDPTALTVGEQHDAILSHLFSALEVMRLAGYDARAISMAAADTTIAFISNLSATSRKQIADAARKFADEVEASGKQPTVN